MERWREGLISLLQDPAVRQTDFDLEDVFNDEGCDINSVELVHVIDEMLFFWRFNMLDKEFGMVGDRSYNKVRIRAFKHVWNKYLDKYAELITDDLMAFYDDYLGTNITLDYIQEGFVVEDNRVKLVTEGVE